MTIVEELRSKVSRDNRELLDRAAEEIEDLDEKLAAAYKKIKELYRTILTKHEKIEELQKQLPPCKVGDVVYQVVDRIYESKIRGVIYDTENYAFDERAIGKSVFLSREKAERDLKERCGQ